MLYLFSSFPVLSSSFFNFFYVGFLVIISRVYLKDKTQSSVSKNDDKDVLHDAYRKALQT